MCTSMELGRSQSVVHSHHRFAARVVQGCTIASVYGPAQSADLNLAIGWLNAAEATKQSCAVLGGDWNYKSVYAHLATAPWSFDDSKLPTTKDSTVAQPTRFLVKGAPIHIVDRKWVPGVPHQVIGLVRSWD